MQAMSATMTAMERMNAATNNPNVGSAMNRARQAIQGAEDAIRQFNSAADDTLAIADNIQSRFSGLNFGNAVVVANQALQLGQQLFGFVDSTARWADSFVNVKARLDNINDGLQTTDELNQMILESANRSRGSYQETADMVAKLGSMAGGAFGSSAEIVAFAEVLNKGLVTSGASAQGAAGAIQQLTQGLASGTLRGDELNSVMEGMPVVAQAIAKYMGYVNEKGQGNIGALKALAEQGLVTADIVKNALFAVSEEINEQFNNMPVTWGQAVDIFQDKFGAAMQPIIERFSEFMNTGRVAAFFDKIIAGIVTVANTVLWLIDIIRRIGAFIKENEQQVIGVLTTVGVILAKYLLIAIGLWIKKTAIAVLGAIKTAAAWALVNWQIVLIAIAIGVLIGWWGQLGSVTRAVIIGIIIGLIMIKLAAMGLPLPFVILIGVLLLVLAGFLFFRDTAVMVVGIVAGAFMWLWAGIQNIGIWIANLFLAVAEFFVNTWNDAVYLVQMAWYLLKLAFFTIVEAIGNAALTVAEFFINTWNEAVYGVEMAFYKFQEGAIKVMSTVASAAQGIVNTILGGIATLINGAIGGLNTLIDLANNIPDVNIPTIGEVSFKTAGDWSANVASLGVNLSAPTAPTAVSLGRLSLAENAGEAPQKSGAANLGRLEYKDMGAAFDAGREWGENAANKIADGIDGLKDKAGNLLGSLKDNLGKNSGGEGEIDLSGYGQAFDESMLGGGKDGKGGKGSGSGSGSKSKNPSGGKLDEVGKIGEEVDISDTDLKYLKDIAQAEYVNKFTTLTPNMTVNISDVKETVDVTAIAEVLEEMFVSSVHGALFST